MSTVRCPSCGRALNLPSTREVTTARCPLCGHVFDVPSRAPASPVVAELPQASPPPIDLAAAHGDPAVPLVPAADQRAADSAVSWLRAAGVVGGVHLFCCSCISFTFLPAANNRA